MRTTVIFDMDGTLLETEAMCQRSWALVGQREGKPYGEVYAGCIGISLEATRDRFLEAFGADFPYEAYEQKMIAAFYELAGEGGIPLRPGAKEILQALRAKGFRIGLASSSLRETIDLEMRAVGLLEYFDAIVGADEIVHPKPAPDIYLAACKAIGAEPEECYAVEDSYDGVRAAAAAGLYTFMVPDLLPATEEMHRLAQHVLPSLHAVQAYILEGK